MKKTIKVALLMIAVISVVSLINTSTAFALTEEQVEKVVNQHGREAITGNIFIWFLCAIAFLKISQKIDTYMSALGLNVGHTGGSLLAEVAIAARGVSMVKRGGRGGVNHKSHTVSDNSQSVLSGGLAGAVGHKITSSGIKNVTGQSNNPITNKAFQSSLSKNGQYATNVIGSVAKGNFANIGSMTGEQASTALKSYLGDNNADSKFRDVEIGGGRITGTEVNAENPGGLQFAMYDAEQYMTPAGDYQEVKSADGNNWYMQYAQDTIKSTPITDAEGKVTVDKSIVKQLDRMPQRKDRV